MRLSSKLTVRYFPAIRTSFKM
uniref:Uncharacterized protein n=1 Tax=Anguilla anguilla TaxID=7936 RepID=A0A0E9QV64_ANGAN